MIASSDNLRVLSLLPGRMRLRLSSWRGQDTEWIENRLCRINGVQSVRANPLTGSILVHFDHRKMEKHALLAQINDVLEGIPNGERPASAGWCQANQQADDCYPPLRVVVRSLLGHAVVDSLWFGVGFLGSAMGLPLAGLGPLHVLMDVAIWALALGSEQGSPTQNRA